MEYGQALIQKEMKCYALQNHLEIMSIKLQIVFFKITAEVFPIDEYRTSVKCIENKKQN